MKVQVLDRLDLPDGRQRIVALSGDDKIHVATIGKGADTGESEMTFELWQATEIAKKMLQGDTRALTMPGLARLMASAVLVLGKVAYLGQAIGDAHGDAGDTDGD